MSQRAWILKRTAFSLFTAVVLFGHVCFAKYSGGAGTADNPFKIATAEDLNDIGNHPEDFSKCFKMTADINLAQYTGSQFKIIGPNDTTPFAGIFDGDNHSILNFGYSSTDRDFTGLFGVVGLYPDEGIIKNLNIINSKVQGRKLHCYAVASMAGYLGESGIAINCSAYQCDVNGGEYIGGLIGGNAGKIYNCHYDGNVTDGDTSGGFVGFNAGNIFDSNSAGIVRGNSAGGFSGRNSVSCWPYVYHYEAGIANCSFEGDVVGDYDDTGGFVGTNNSANIRNCYAKARVRGKGWTTGGLVGASYGNISASFTAGSVQGTQHVGGLVGQNSEFGSIADCYSISSVEGNNFVGGLAGQTYGHIYNSYSIGPVAGDTNIGGLVGLISYGLSLTGYGRIVNSFWDVNTSGMQNSNGGIGKTTTEMRKADTFKGWGCGELWRIDDGNDYPRLVWENNDGSVIGTQGIWQGVGEPNNPYLIWNAEQLNAIGLIPCSWDRCFKLMADIDLNGVVYNIIGDSERPFTGVFDGDGHLIYNFHYDNGDFPYYDSVGLFGVVKGFSAQVKNLGLIDPNIHGENHIGSLVGTLAAGKVANCFSDGGYVSGDGYVGGLVGYMYRDWDVDSASVIMDCYSTTDVAGKYYAGGLVGSIPVFTEVIITRVYSAGLVSADRRAGGLIGFPDVDIFSTSPQPYPIISGAFWDINTSGQNSSAGGKGKTNAEMKTMSTFTSAGWDFVGETINGTKDIWDINEGLDYPRLTWLSDAEGLIQVTKCNITSTNKYKTGTISISGITPDYPLLYDDIELTINSADTVGGHFVQKFNAYSTNFKNGRYRYSGTQNGVKMLLTIDLKTHKFAFVARNAYLSGLSCPLTLQIRIEGKIGSANLDELVVNGPKKPIPIKLLMGVKNSLRVDKSKFTRDIKTGNITQIVVSGGFSVKDPEIDMTMNSLSVNIGTQTFAIPANTFKNSRGRFTCSKVVLPGGEIASAVFNFKTGAFTLKIKNTKIADAGTAALNMEFGEFNEGAEVLLP